jgi:hypothetical protein
MKGKFKFPPLLVAKKTDHGIDDPGTVHRYRCRTIISSLKVNVVLVEN